MASPHTLSTTMAPDFRGSSLHANLARVLVCVLGLCGWLARPTSTIGQEDSTRSDRPLDFRKDIQPIWERHCVECHGVDKQEGGLRLDLRESGLKGGDNFAPVIVPGKSAQSPLFQFVSREDADLKMPPKGKRLSDAEIAMLGRWIDAGAEWPADQVPVASRASKHWSFQPIVRPEVPPVALAPLDGTHPAADAIDAFVAKQLGDVGLAGSPPADRRTLIRRLYLLMHGLPPTPDQVQTFVNDPSPDAWPALVDRVLDSPRYGERWAQHWLDLVRFGETNGFETNRERPTAWPYRDYVIDAFQSDKPYDQFVREQIAGDATGNPVGTGFLVAGPYDLVKSQDVNLTLMQRQDEFADMINTTSTAFLGLTVGCARCHNHKFDPITQRDYYALQAVFAGVQHGERPLPLPEERAAQIEQLDKTIATLTRQMEPFLPRPALREAVQAKQNFERFAPTSAKFVRFTIEATNASEPCLDELAVFSGAENVALAKSGTKARCSSSLPGYAIHKLEHIHDGLYGNSHSWISNEPGTGWVELEFPESRTIDRIEWGRDREGQFQDRVATRYRIAVANEPGKWRPVASSDDRAPFSNAPANAPPMYRFDHVPPELAKQGQAWLRELEEARGLRGKLAASTVAYVGRFEQPGATHRLFRGEPNAPREEVGPNAIAFLGNLDLPATAPEQQRRVALANWLTRAENPLTARVWVNRIWQFQFGRGLVDTPNDFGANGVAPSHPELLDWLARELMERGWSTKHIQRAILTSRTWRQDNRPQDLALQKDASCRLWWRFPPRRLEAEAMRDGILSVTGVLDLRAGGPGFDGFEVQLENVRHYFPKKTFGPNDWRRMVFMTKVRMEKESTFGAFDCPDASQVVARRSLSTTPLQALNLLNSEFIQQQSALFASRLTKDAPAGHEDQVRRAYGLCYGRPPDEREIREAAGFIGEYGLEQFCRAVLNSNEFLFIP